MSIERSDDHPTHESNGNTITSLAAPARGEVRLPAVGGAEDHRG